MQALSTGPFTGHFISYTLVVVFWTLFFLLCGKCLKHPSDDGHCSYKGMEMISNNT